MKRILIGLGVMAAGAAVALGVRSGGEERSAEEVAPAGVEVMAGPADPEAGPRLAPDDGAGVEERSARLGDRQAASPSPKRGSDSTAAPEVSPAGTVVSDARTAASATASPGAASASVPAATVEDQENAEAVLRRASEAYDAVTSLQADFVQTARNPLLGTRVTSRGTLYQRRPDRFLMKFSDPAGDVIVSDGQYIWVYYPSVDEDQVMRAPAGAAGAGGVDLQAQFLGDPVARFRSELHGKEEVGGRPAYVLTMVPREPMGYRSLKVWVDAGDYLVRRFEIVEDNGVTRHLELSGLRLNASLDDSLFRFTPPPGARIVQR